MLVGNRMVKLQKPRKIKLQKPRKRVNCKKPCKVQSAKCKVPIAKTVHHGELNSTENWTPAVELYDLFVWLCSSAALKLRAVTRPYKEKWVKGSTFANYVCSTRVQRGFLVSNQDGGVLACALSKPRCVKRAGRAVQLVTHEVWLQLGAQQLLWGCHTREVCTCCHVYLEVRSWARERFFYLGCELVPRVF